MKSVKKLKLIFLLLQNCWHLIYTNIFEFEKKIQMFMILKFPPKNTGLNHRFTNQNKNETNFNYNNFVFFAKKLASLNFLFEKKIFFF